MFMNKLDDYPITYSERKKVTVKKKTIDTPKKKSFLPVLITVGIIIFLIGIIVLAIILSKRLQKQVPEPDCQIDSSCPKNEIKPIKERKLGKEFEIATIPGVLYRVSVIQKSEDETKTNGKSFTVKSVRKTKYDIYIISEEESDEKNKYYYSKMYTAAISLVSECNSLDTDDCEPDVMVDFTGGTKKTESNARILNSVEDYKDLPIPLCLFNITDNDFITSITCPESFPEIQKNTILLDLYFFRPPAIERPDKKNNNINITKTEDKARNRKYIFEKNEGLCNINNNLGSLCKTEMNFTTSLEGNLLQYDERAITNITTDHNNYYIKKKVTHLVDETEKIDNLDPYKYKKSLDNLLPF